MLFRSAFNDYRLEAVTFSKQEQQILKKMLQNISLDGIDNSVLGNRELTEFQAKMAKILS